MWYCKNKIYRTRGKKVSLENKEYAPITFRRQTLTGFIGFKTESPFGRSRLHQNMLYTCVPIINLENS